MRGLHSVIGAALVCNVVLVSQFPSPAIAGLFGYLHDQLPVTLLSQLQEIRIAAKGSTKSSKTMVLEGVAIFDLSEDNKSSSVLWSEQCLRYISLSNGPALTKTMIERLRGTSHGTPWGNIVSTSAQLVELRECEIIRKRPFCEPDNRILLDVVCWSKSIVLENKTNPKFTTGLDIDEVRGNTGDIRAQLPLGCGICPTHKPFGRFPQTPSSYAENAGSNPKDRGPDGNDALSVNPFKTATPSKRAPFLPVFGLGALTFLAGLFAGINVYDRGSRTIGWHRYLLQCAAMLIVCLCSFSFAFGFPWAALF